MIEERNDLTARTLSEATAVLESGTLQPSTQLADCLAQIDHYEGTIRAWAHLDRDFTLAQARRADARRAAGRRLSLLDGVPFGIKDNIDTEAFPTEMGSPIHQGRWPDADAWIVSALRGLGMVPLGKTVTTPFGMNAPAPTRNPLDPSLTLGASSVGSAAAVASGMVPITVNTQNTSSTTRPAAYAGVPAWKPTHDLIPLDGCLPLCPPTATVAFMARAVEDFVLLAEALELKRPEADVDAADFARIAAVRGPWWGLAKPEAARAFDDFLGCVGIERDVPLAERFGQALPAHRDLIAADMAVTLAEEFAQHRSQLPEEAISFIEAGRSLPATRYVDAMRLRGHLAAELEAAMGDCDALVTLSTPGPPPTTTEGIGDGTFSMPWTFMGLPTLSLPLLADPQGRPSGIQVIGRRYQDRKLLCIGMLLAGGEAMDRVSN